MSASTAFLLGLGAGFVLGAVLVWLILRASSSTSQQVAQKAFAAEDAADKKATADLAALEQKRKDAHAAIDTLSPDELDSVLNGRATVDDVVRARKAAEPSGDKAPASVEPGKPAS